MALNTIAVTMGMLEQNPSVCRRYEDIISSTELPISMLYWVVGVLNI